MAVIPLAREKVAAEAGSSPTQSAIITKGSNNSRRKLSVPKDPQNNGIRFFRAMRSRKNLRRRRLVKESSDHASNADLVSSTPVDQLPVSRHHEDDDGETECSFYSLDSIMSGSDNDNSSIESSCRGLTRIKRRFEIRDRTLEKLCKGSSKLYRDMLLANEQAGRQVTLADFQKKSSKMLEKEKDRLIGIQVYPNKEEEPLSGLLKRLCLFEARHCTEGSLAVIVSCVGTMSLYSLYEQLTRILYKKLLASYLSVDTFYLVLVVLGFLMMRTNGYMWYWVGSKSFKQVKFEMHNRSKLRYIDARILAALKGTFLNSLMNLWGYFSVYSGIFYFYDNIMEHKFYTPTESWYKEVELEVFTQIPPVPPGEAMACVHYLQFASTPLRGRIAHALCVTDDQTVFYHLAFVIVSAVILHYILHRKLVEVVD